MRDGWVDDERWDEGSRIKKPREDPWIMELVRRFGRLRGDRRG